jgi:hypothetical protein
LLSSPHGASPFEGYARRWQDPFGRKRIMRTAPLLLCFALLAPHATAQTARDMPIYDVDRHCRTIANFGGSYSATLDRSCFGQEQQAYDGLKPRWGALPARMRQHCDEIARFGGTGSYTLLSSCVRMEEAAAAGNAGRQFRR